MFSDLRGLKENMELRTHTTAHGGGRRGGERVPSREMKSIHVAAVNFLLGRGTDVCHGKCAMDGQISFRMWKPFPQLRNAASASTYVAAECKKRRRRR